MKVFVITIDDVYSMSTNYHCPRVFLKKEDAMKAFEEIIKDFEREENMEKYVVEQADYVYCAYVSDDYTDNHYEICVDEIEVE